MAKSVFLILSVAAVLLPSTIFASPKVFGFDVIKQRNVLPVTSHLQRRATVQAKIGNGEIFYYANVTIGTPPQPFVLQLDTGSSDIWVPSANSNVCQMTDNCQITGAFDPNASKTFHEIAIGTFNISYVDGSGITGDYIADVFRIGKTNLQSMTMGLATDASRSLGIMGIGYAAGEAIAEEKPGQGYSNVIDVLKQQGFINTKAYSLWLNDLDADTGSILFGGVDTSRYTGPLIGLPIQKDSDTGSLTSFTVAFTSLSVKDSTGSAKLTNNKISVPAILDSGTTDTLLPDDVAADILSGVGAIEDEEYGFLVPCDLASTKATFTFGFGGSDGPNINVALSEFVLPLLDNNDQPLTFDDGTQACSFGLEPAQGRPILFGDTFLRSAYVVYDLETNQIALAQTNFGSKLPNIVEFAKDGSIPGVKNIASEVTVTQTFTGYPLITAAATKIGDTGGKVTDAPSAASFSLTTSGSQASSISTSTSTSTSSSSGSAKSSGAAFAQRAPGVEFIGILSSIVAGVSMIFGSSLVPLL